jgi:hypothetical protein
MRRRELLAGAAGVAGAAATAGCTLPTGLDRPGSPIRDVRFAEVTPRKNRPIDTDPEGRDRYPPIVEWAGGESAVYVEGFVFYGGGCDAPVLRTVELRPDGRLFVRVGGRRKWYLRLPVPIPVGCTAALGGIHYRVAVRFADGADLPGTVEVVEENEGAPDARRVVDRAEQRALCSRDEFESEARRATAHWTCPTE